MQDRDRPGPRLAALHPDGAVTIPQPSEGGAHIVLVMDVDGDYYTMSQRFPSPEETALALESIAADIRTGAAAAVSRRVRPDAG